MQIYLRDKKDTPASEQDYREERYHRIISNCIFFGYEYAATGHHADDQLETLLMKICRGSGLRGISGIASSLKMDCVHFVRPLLDVTKEEIYEICVKNNIPFNEDLSNEDTQYTRNKIRNDIIPQLRAIFPNYALHANNISQTARHVQSLVEDQLALLRRYEKFETKISADALRPLE
jgi:tRNA(Ile)-lysidine synthase TilS/MesJ